MSSAAPISKNQVLVVSTEPFTASNVIPSLGDNTIR